MKAYYLIQWRFCLPCARWIHSVHFHPTSPRHVLILFSHICFFFYQTVSFIYEYRLVLLQLINQDIQGWVLPLCSRKTPVYEDGSFFYIHGSVLRESNLISVQEGAIVFSLLCFCRQLYMFRVLNAVTTQQWEWMVVNPVDQAKSCNYSCTSSRWWVSTPKTGRAAYRNIINWISRILWDNSNSTKRVVGCKPSWPVPEAVITVVRAPDNGCQHPNR